MNRRWLLVACCALAGCKQLFSLDEPTLGGTSDGGVGDGATIVDAGTCISASAMCLGDTLRTCSAPGQQAVDTDCMWGCGTSSTNPASHCKELVPAGGGATSSDLDPSGLTTAITLPDGIIVDGDTGRIGTSANPVSIRGAGTGIVNGIDYNVHNGVAVFRMYLLSVTGTVLLVGTHPIALVSASDLAVTGVIDARGTCVNLAAGPGGFAGGTIDADGAGTGAGKAKATISGGGGAGYGGKGGDSGPLSGASAGGNPYGDAAISMLVGGSGGGGASNGGAAAGIGGGGGGAVQLLSNTFISIAAAGGINAGGCGGKSGGGGNDGGGGGGSGGTIVLEAPRVIINGALAVNGGAGGAGGGGGSGYGESGRLDRMRARTSTGTYGGGMGGAAATLDGGDASAAGKGGGGAGVGRIRITTLADTGLTVAPSAVLSPALTDPNTTCTRAASVTR